MESPVPEVSTLKKMDLKFTFSVNDYAATYNPYWAPGLERTIVGKVLAVGTSYIRLRPFNVDSMGKCTPARGPALNYYLGACWPVFLNEGVLPVDPEKVLTEVEAEAPRKKLPKGWVWADEPKQLKRKTCEDKDSLHTLKKCKVAEVAKFKSADPELKEVVNTSIARALMEECGRLAKRALVLDTRAFNTTRKLLKQFPWLTVDIPNSDLEEVAAMTRSTAFSDRVRVEHCTAHDMLLRGDARKKYQLVFLDYCGTWRLDDVQLLLQKRMACRGIVAITICRRTPKPDADRTEEDRMRQEFDRAANDAGFAHTCLKTYRYTGSMLTVLYQVRKT